MPAYEVYAPVPKKMVPVMHGMGVRRGPKVGYNTFQPRFRARPGRVISTRPMFTPLNVTFQSKVVGYGIGGTRPTYHHKIREKARFYINFPRIVCWFEGKALLLQSN